jgi:hypothetical protein
MQEPNHENLLKIIDDILKKYKSKDVNLSIQEVSKEPG